MDIGQVRQRIEDMAEPEYRRFAQSLLPQVEGVLGVRLPRLRALARELVRQDWRAFLEQAGEESFEEIMLQGMVIGYAQADTEEILSYVAAFVPKVNNWSVCDSFCSSLKLARREPERVYAFLAPYLKEQRTFPLRFGVVMLLQYFIDGTHVQDVLHRLTSAWQGEEYARLAVAWALAECALRYPQPTLCHLAAHPLPEQTRRLFTRKVLDSTRADATLRAAARAL